MNNSLSYKKLGQFNAYPLFPLLPAVSKIVSKEKGGIFYYATQTF
jgi:hypothetical protein